MNATQRLYSPASWHCCYAGRPAQDLQPPVQELSSSWDMLRWWASWGQCRWPCELRAERSVRRPLEGEFLEARHGTERPGLPKVAEIVRIKYDKNLRTYGSHSIGVMGGDSCSGGQGFESQHGILDGHFPHLLVAKILVFVWKDENKWKKDRGWPNFKNVPTCEYSISDAIKKAEIMAQFTCKQFIHKEVL